MRGAKEKRTAEPAATELGDGTEVEAGAATEARHRRREGKRLHKGEGQRKPRGRGCGDGRAQRESPRREEGPAWGRVVGGRGRGSSPKGPFGEETPTEESPGGGKRRLGAEGTRGGGGFPTDGTRGEGTGGEREGPAQRGPGGGGRIRAQGRGEGRPVLRGQRGGENEGRGGGNQAGGGSARRGTGKKGEEREGPRRGGPG